MLQNVWQKIKYFFIVYRHKLCMNIIQADNDRKYIHFFFIPMA